MNRRDLLSIVPLAVLAAAKSGTVPYHTVRQHYIRPYGDVATNAEPRFIICRSGDYEVAVRTVGAATHRIAWDSAHGVEP